MYHINNTKKYKDMKTLATDFKSTIRWSLISKDNVQRAHVKVNVSGVRYVLEYTDTIEIL